MMLRLVAAGIAFAAVTAFAEEGRLSNACDRAAASLTDRSRPAGITGVDMKKMDAKVAIPACEAALAVAPENPRFTLR
jgi:hypothetical protein